MICPYMHLSAYYVPSAILSALEWNKEMPSSPRAYILVLHSYVTVKWFTCLSPLFVCKFLHAKPISWSSLILQCWLQFLGPTGRAQWVAFELNSKSGIKRSRSTEWYWFGLGRTEALDSSLGSTPHKPGDHLQVTLPLWSYFPTCKVERMVIHSSWGCGLWQGLRDRLLKVISAKEST